MDFRMLDSRRKVLFVHSRISEMMQQFCMFLCIAGLMASAAADMHAQEVGTCEPGRAEAFLDANNARAAVYNAGNLFWRRNENTYTVPKEERVDAFFAANLWIGGLVDGELRFAGTDYGPFEFFPGPLTEAGELPNASDCSAYDRIYEITVRDLEQLDETGDVTADIRDWPWQLGAPVRDGDGNPENYDLAAGDRPDITGHQMFWWVMNDLGGQHGWGGTQPLGIEVRASAFAVLSTDPSLDHATFYRYQISNKQSYTIENTYVGLWADADLGFLHDDFVGSDTLLGMAYFYNADDVDDRPSGYGAAPPALGIDFVQGVLARHDELDNDADGEVDEDGERKSMSTVIHLTGADWGWGAPAAYAAYGYLRGIWLDGKPLTVGGTGYGGTTPASFAFPGDPVTGSYWSEMNMDGDGARNTPGDRRLIMSIGPFRLEPQQTEEIVVAVVWARGTDHLDSVTELRKADRAVQEAWDDSRLDGTLLPPPPETRPLLVAPAHHVAGQPTNLRMTWAPVPYASKYHVDVSTSPEFDSPSTQTFTSPYASVEVDSLAPFTEYYWRVRS